LRETSSGTRLSPGRVSLKLSSKIFRFPPSRERRLKVFGILAETFAETSLALNPVPNPFQHRSGISASFGHPGFARGEVPA